MNTRDISHAKDPDLRSSLTALRRAAEQARLTAIQTGTHLVVVKEGKIVRIPPDALRAQANTSSASTS
jgi:hypothetical protein